MYAAQAVSSIYGVNIQQGNVAECRHRLFELVDAPYTRLFSNDDYRERSLKDVITHLEPGLFKKVTGLSVKDFDLLVSLGVFNSALMNDAVYKFKRYEDASLEYVGINKHDGQNVGLYDTVLSANDYAHTFVNEA